MQYHLNSHIEPGSSDAKRKWAPTVRICGVRPSCGHHFWFGPAIITRYSSECPFVALFIIPPSGKFYTFFISEYRYFWTCSGHPFVATTFLLSTYCLLTYSFFFFKVTLMMKKVFPTWIGSTRAFIACEVQSFLVSNKKLVLEQRQLEWYFFSVFFWKLAFRSLLL